MRALYWIPEWNPAVVGYYDPRTEDMDEGDPQVVDMECLACGSRWRAFCHSGRPYRRIEAFGLLHAACWYGSLDYVVSR